MKIYIFKNIRNHISRLLLRKKPRRMTSIQLQSFLLMFAVIIIITFATKWTYKISIEYNNTKINEYNKQNYNQIKESFITRQNKIFTMMTSLSYIETLQKIVMNKKLEYNDREWDIFYNLLCSYSLLDKGIEDVMVVDNLGEIYNFNYTYTIEQDKIKKVAELASRGREYSDIIILNKKRLFSMSIPIYYYDTTQYRLQKPMETRIGTCIFLMNTDYIYSLLKNAASKEGLNLFIMDSSGNIVSQNDDGIQGFNDVASLLHNSEESINKEMIPITINNKDYLLYINPINNYGWNIVGLTSADNISSNKIKALIVSIWAIVVFLILSLVFLFTKTINSFITHLNSHMKKIKEGVFDLKMKPWRKKEFISVAEGFNSMMNQILKLTENNLNIQRKLYEEELDKKHITLMALQSQINPHFLYNTLECLKNIGIYYNIKEMYSVSESLAFILRYGVKGHNIVHVKDEVKCIKHYINIQDVRFDNKFKIEYDVREDVLEMLMLKMVLQPIVENAIWHGLEPKTENCKLKLSIKMQDDYIVMEVMDNGIGIPGDKLCELNGQANTDARSDSETSGIGIFNVRERLLLYYGKKASMLFSSEFGKGTLVTIKIPKNFEVQ